MRRGVSRRSASAWPPGAGAHARRRSYSARPACDAGRPRAVAYGRRGAPAAPGTAPASRHPGGRRAARRCAVPAPAKPPRAGAAATRWRPAARSRRFGADRPRRVDGAQFALRPPPVHRLLDLVGSVGHPAAGRRCRIARVADRSRSRHRAGPRALRRGRSRGTGQQVELGRPLDERVLGLEGRRTATTPRSPACARPTRAARRGSSRAPSARTLPARTRPSSASSVSSSATSGIGRVDLVEVDLVDPHATQARVTRAADPLGRKSLAAGFADREAHLGGDNDVAAPASRATGEAPPRRRRRRRRPRCR